MSEAKPKVHALKCWPDYYAEVVAGRKAFEIRYNDRNFQVGDVLVLQEWSLGTQQYTGEMVSRTITYMTDFEQKPGFVVLSLRDDAALTPVEGGQDE